METADRHAQSDLIRQLLDQPQVFQALQAMRLLQQAGVSWRVESHAHLTFPVAELHAINRHDAEMTLQCDATGLTGSQGIMPLSFSEELIGQYKQKNFALQAFLNILHHRHMELLQAAWRKHRPSLLAEHRPDNGYVRLLAALSGFHASLFRNGSSHPATHSLLTKQWVWAGHWARPIRTAAGLQTYLQLQFGLAARVEQFVPTPVAIPPTAQTQLSGADHNNQLGKNAVVGETSWQLQQHFLVDIDVSCRATLAALKPDSPLLTHLKQAIALYSGPEQSFSITIQVCSGLFGQACLSLDSQAENQLGWGMQLCSPGARPAHKLSLTLHT